MATVILNTINQTCSSKSTRVTGETESVVSESWLAKRGGELVITGLQINVSLFNNVKELKSLDQSKQFQLHGNSHLESKES